MRHLALLLLGCLLAGCSAAPAPAPTPTPTVKPPSPTDELKALLEGPMAARDKLDLLATKIGSEIRCDVSKMKSGGGYLLTVIQPEALPDAEFFAALAKVMPAFNLCQVKRIEVVHPHVTVSRMTDQAYQASRTGPGGYYYYTPGKMHETRHESREVVGVIKMKSIDKYVTSKSLKPWDPIPAVVLKNAFEKA